MSRPTITITINVVRVRHLTTARIPVTTDTAANFKPLELATKMSL